MVELNGDTTIEEWCSNGQGGYIAWKLAQFIFYAATKKQMSDTEAQEMVKEAQARAKARRSG